MTSESPHSSDAPAAQAGPRPPKPSSIRGLWLSFYSPDFYREVARRWRGMGALYLLCLLIGCWVPFFLAMDFALTHLLEDAVLPIVRQLPPIAIRHGRVTISADQPVHIRHSETGAVMAILDTTGETTTLQDTGAWLLLTDTHLLTQWKEWEKQKVSLQNVEDFYVDAPLLALALQRSKRWFVLGAFPLAVGVSYGYRIVLALLLGLAGLGFSKMLGAGLHYRSTVRMSAVAMTPALILDTAVSVSLLLKAPAESIPFWWLICIGISVAYLFGAVAANVRQQAA